MIGNDRTRRLRPVHAMFAAVLAAALVAACGGSDSPAPAAPATPPVAAGPVPEIRVLSNRADVISGGDALVQLLAPAGVNPATLKVDVDGVDVTTAFALRADGRYYGLVKGLKVGKNILRATLPGKDSGKLEITNYPIGGPVISGAQVMPWTCATKVASPSATNPDLGDPLDAQCNIAAPVYRYQYRTLGGSFCSSTTFRNLARASLKA